MSYNGFTFNSKHSSNFNIVMLSVDRTLLPAKRRDAYVIPGRSGNYYDSSDTDYDNRQIRVQISFRGKEYSIESLRQQIRDIAKWLSANDAPLIFDDEPDKAYTASIDAGLSLTNLMRWGQCELTFNCQPFAQSVQYVTETKDMTENNDSLTANISGTQDTPCIITIKNIGTTNITGITVQRKAGRA